MARQGRARRGRARLGKAWHGAARQGVAWQGRAGRGKARQGILLKKEDPNDIYHRAHLLTGQGIIIDPATLLGLNEEGEREMTLETAAEGARHASFKAAIASMAFADGGVLSAFTVEDARQFLPALEQMHRYGWNQGQDTLQQRLAEAERLLQEVLKQGSAPMLCLEMHSFLIRGEETA